METIRLVPSTYSSSNPSVVSVSDANNMYTNVDSTTYATITTVSNNTTSYAVFIKGFNFSDVPADATIDSFSVKIRGYQTGLTTGANYRPRLSNNTTIISNTTATTDFSGTTKTITIPTGSLTWNDLVQYGADFGVRVVLRRSSSTRQGYLYIYGVEIEVNYTLPSQITNVRVKSGGVWTQPQKILVKQNGEWVEAKKLLVKSGGTWK